jgi:dolichyl-phosphate-mannose-protein mannosyltransferase
MAVAAAGGEGEGAGSSETGSGADVVRFFDLVTLKHVNTGAYLHSHPMRFPAGSKQQQVTCYAGEDGNNLWCVQPGNAQREDMIKSWGKAVEHGDAIRLLHCATGFYLHSHPRVESPVTKQQEVTCYEFRDANDDWTLRLTEDKRVWRAEIVVNLMHRETDRSLHSHSSKLPDWGHSQQEVTAYDKRDSNDNWIIGKIVRK